MMRSHFALALLISLIVFQIGCKPESAYKTPPPPQVTVITPTIQTVPIFLEENGQTEAVEQATIQARVRGILQEVKFEPDSYVEEGTELFQIEQQEYLAEVKSAEATLNSAKAALETANAAVGVAEARIAEADAAIKVSQATFDRMEKLQSNNAIAQSEYDSARAALETSTAARLGAVAAKVADEASVTNAEAQVEKANADLIQAQLDLEWTVVVAPISGRVTKTMVKRGNLVENGTELVEIVRNNPIWANFNISESFVLNLEREKAQREVDKSKVMVELKRSGDVGFPFQGHLDYADPRIDQDTGTLQLRAVFENPPENSSILIPGLFVRVRLKIGEYEDAVLIPERAVNRDQTGSFVYVVDNENKAIRKDVELGTKSEDNIVVTSGVSANDSVIVDGIQRVRPGTVVDPS